MTKLRLIIILSIASMFGCSSSEIAEKKDITCKNAELPPKCNVQRSQIPVGMNVIPIAIVDYKNLLLVQPGDRIALYNDHNIVCDDATVFGTGFEDKMASCGPRPPKFIVSLLAGEELVSKIKYAQKNGKFTAEVLE